MLYRMKLHDEPFKAIKNKEKTIEMRLNDEKRRGITKGDSIEFKNTITGGVFYVKVINVYHYKDFNELYQNHDKLSLGYKENEKADPKDMNLYYKDEDILKYGVLAIEIVDDEYENDKVIRINNTIDIVNEVLGTDIDKIKTN